MIKILFIIYLSGVFASLGFLYEIQKTLRGQITLGECIFCLLSWLTVWLITGTIEYDNYLKIKQADNKSLINKIYEKIIFDFTKEK